MPQSYEISLLGPGIADNGDNTYRDNVITTNTVDPKTRPLRTQLFRFFNLLGYFVAISLLM